MKKIKLFAVWHREYTLGATLCFALLLPLRIAIAQSSDYPAVPIFKTGYVLDETNSLAPDQVSALDAKLRHYQDSTSTQICILLVPTLNGNPVEDFAVAVYDSNK
ncbi:MAG TPA: TPM domain-containing protein, partial [Candidatus Kapabacteria bacterium]|nr:TPM domain-containing protein [Candidatus Kapabacteria bacterium]